MIEHKDEASCSSKAETVEKPKNLNAVHSKKVTSCGRLLTDHANIDMLCGFVILKGTNGKYLFLLSNRRSLKPRILAPVDLQGSTRRLVV